MIYVDGFVAPLASGIGKLLIFGGFQAVIDA